MACGPVRSNPGSSVEEIVVITRDYDIAFSGEHGINGNDGYPVYIFNVASSSWRRGEFAFFFDPNSLQLNYNCSSNAANGPAISRRFCCEMHTTPFESTFLVSDGSNFKYNSSTESFDQMPMNMSASIGYRFSPILIDLDTFPSCNDTFTLSTTTTTT